MEKDTSKRLMGLFIVIIMFFSVAGYAAFSGLSGTSNQPPASQQQQPDVPTIAQIVDRELTNGEKRLALNTGRTIVEYFYPNGCGSPCEDDKKILENMITNAGEFAILEEIKGKTNTTSLQIVSRDKTNPTNALVKKLENFTAESAFNAFCDAALVLPKSCILRDVLA